MTSQIDNRQHAIRSICQVLKHLKDSSCNCDDKEFIRQIMAVYNISSRIALTYLNDAKNLINY